MLSLFAHCTVLIFIYMVLLFLAAVKTKNNSIADRGWGFGFLLIAYYTLLHTGTYAPRHLLATSLVTIWAVRLCIYIVMRSWAKPEDKRYAAWRIAWGNSVILRSFFQVFMLQGLLMLIIAYPIILINTSSPSALNFLDIGGALVWLFGFIFESIADLQLDRFIKNPLNKGKVMKYGLWRFSRHPNYFGEATLWWGIWLIALSVAYGITGIISPITITILLAFVSGVPLIEQQFIGNPEYDAYKKETSALIPWFYKKS